MIGRAVRRLAGPFEPALADAYRSLFFNVDVFAARLADLGAAGLVVEIGCGEGALITALAQRLRQTRFIGVDISAQVGRLFAGDRERVRFVQGDAVPLAQQHAGQADLVLICDVMHHAPPAAQRQLWLAARRLLRPGARLVLKEWIKTRSPAYYAGYASDRLITGDRILYRSRQQWADDAVREGWRIEAEWSLRPWAANHAFVLKAASPP